MDTMTGMLLIAAACVAVLFITSCAEKPHFYCIFWFG